jgi:hypothetical protein
VLFVHTDERELAVIDVSISAKFMCFRDRRQRARLQDAVVVAAATKKIAPKQLPQPLLVDDAHEFFRVMEYKFCKAYAGHAKRAPCVRGAQAHCAGRLCLTMHGGGVQSG